MLKNMENVRSRIQQVLKKRELSVNALAANYGVQQKTLNNQVKGPTAISASTLLLLLEQFPDLSAEWLLRGTGDMLMNDEANTTTRRSHNVPASEHTLTKKERVQALIDYYCDGRKQDFANMLGVSPSTISSWFSRNTLDYELLFAKCEALSAYWLLTGDGEMLVNDEANTTTRRRRDEDETKTSADNYETTIKDLRKTVATQDELIASYRERIEELKRGTAPQTYVATA